MTSRVLTPRVLALAAAAALAGTPLLAGSPAHAQQAGTVTFTGGCGLLGSGLGGSSTPDTSELKVPAGAGVRFANRLGQPATLMLNGESVGEVPAGGVADVVFRDGPVTASMQVSCMLDSPAGTVTVEVVHAAPAPPPPAASPDLRPPRPAPPPPAGGGMQGAEVPDARARTGAEGAWWPVPAKPPASQPDDATARDGRDNPGRHGDRRGRWAIDVEPADGGATSAEPATVDTELAEDELAAQPMSQTAGSTSDDGPVGLLALIATVCVVGVSAGAVRALITQRANRAEWA